MPKNTYIAYGLTAAAGFAMASLAIWWFWPDILERIEQRPWPPVLSELSEAVEAGDTYSVVWQPPSGGPQPEFHIVETSTALDFKGAARQYVPYKAGQKPSLQRVASAVTTPTTYHLRVLSGYKSKYYAAAEVLSQPSNVESVTVKPLPVPSVFSIKGPIFSAETYTVSWSAVSKANSYEIDVQPPLPSGTPFQSGTSLSVTAPELSSPSVSYCYRVRAARAIGASLIPITNWSNKQCVQVKQVTPPASLKVTPAPVESEKPYTLSWTAPSPGPSPTSAYEYRIRRNFAGKVDELPWQKAITLTAKAPKVSSKQTLQFSVKARSNGHPMTAYSPSVSLTVTPPPPPPTPTISKVSPAFATHGDTVTVTGTHLASAKLSLFVAAGNTLSVTPKSQSASSVSFVVPAAASLKTTEVRLVSGSKLAKAAFTVARKPGKFIERQDQVHIVPLNRTCGKFSSKLTVINAGKHEYAGSFAQGSKVLVSIPFPGFKAYSYGPDIVGGLGFSKGCKVGVQIGEAKSSTALMFVNFYALALGADSSFSAGAKIKGPHTIRPSVYFKKGFKLVFSPDDTIAAVINRREPFGDQYGITIWALDLLTGKKITGSPYLYDGKTGSSFELSVNKSNEFSIKRGGTTEKTVMIDRP